MINCRQATTSSFVRSRTLLIDSMRRTESMNLLDIILPQHRLHQPRRFLFDFFRAHGILRTAAAVDHMLAHYPDRLLT